MNKVISTAGYQNIHLSYDLKVGNLGLAGLVGAPSETTDLPKHMVDHNDVQDQLTIEYSTDGKANSNDTKVWTECESDGTHTWVGRDALRAIGTEVWATRTIDLSGISAVSNNANFQLKFSWQFNTKAYSYDPPGSEAAGLADEGWWDNVKVMGDVVPEPSPLLAFATGLCGLAGFAARRKRQ